MYSTLRRAAVTMLAAGALLAGAAPAWGSSYGVSSFEVQATNQNGTPDTQAGSHPFDITTTFSLNATENGLPAANQRDATIDMPAGFVGNPTAVPTCPRANVGTGTCPADSQVGVITLKVADPALGMFFGEQISTGVYNLVTRSGEAADFAFSVFAIPIHMEVGLRSESDYGVRVKMTNVPEGLPFTKVSLTLWGVPGAAAHDAERGSDYNCSGLVSEQFCGGGGESAGGSDEAFLTLPTSCQVPMVSTISTDSWENPGEFSTATYSGATPTGCEKPRFAPSIQLTPDNANAGAPTGLRLTLAQQQEEAPNGLASSALRDARITLPEGLVLSPSGANGRAACTDEQLGIGTARPVSCPSASRVGSVTIDTPLLEEPLSGGMFVGQPKSGEPYRLFLVAENAQHGVTVRLRASVTADPSTGRLSLTLLEAPQVPVSKMVSELEGGERALLRNPTSCGTATTTATLTPWATPETVSDAESSYTVTGQCGAKPFAPGFVAGAVEPQAGAASPFTFTLSRGEGEQPLGGVSVTLPPGVSALLKSVPRCSATAATAGACPASSSIGDVSVAAGAGADPLWVEGGKAYLTGPYEGAPFGLSIVVPAVAGPFDLGNVVVRATVNVDPSTAQVVVNTDPLPQILEGVPLELRRATVSIDRAKFMLNPTSCVRTSVQASIRSAGGATHAASAPFNVANCAKLKFDPTFVASTRGRVSRRFGASLKVKITQKSGEAALHKIEVQLPRLLPSRTETLKLACSAKQFAADPAGCPKHSMVGKAVVRTPIFGAALAGPAILVSHAGASFPDLELDLKAEGVTIELDGRTNIKKGITYTRFESIPGDPISSVELTLPEGKHSILGAPAANRSFCGRRLVMPTTIVGQNGARVRRRVEIKPTGCRKAG